MSKFLSKPNVRFCIAIGAATGIGQVLFRALTANLGPILGLATGAIAIAAITLAIYFALTLSAKRA